MKNLLYKEFKLCVPVIGYVLVILFPLLGLFPNYPYFVGCIYIVPVFSLIFLGTQKGKQTNDIYLTPILPVRKKDIVAARAISVCSIEIFSLLLLAVLSPLKILIDSNIASQQGAVTPITILGPGLISGFSFCLISYLIFNAIFFLFYYRNARSVTPPTIIGSIVHISIILFTTIIIPIIPALRKAFIEIGYQYELIYLAVAIVLFVGGMILVTRKATKLLLKVDL